MKKYLGLIIALVLLTGCATADYWQIDSTVSKTTTIQTQDTTVWEYSVDTNIIIKESEKITFIPITTKIITTDTTYSDNSTPTISTITTLLISEKWSINSTLIAGLSPHPRLLITKQSYSILTNMAKTNSIEWQNLIKYTGSGTSPDEAMVNQALAYQGLKEIDPTKAQQYAQGCLSNLSTVLSRARPTSENVTGWTSMIFLALRSSS